MNSSNINELLELCPIVAAIRDELFEEALNSPVEIIFLLEANIMTAANNIKRAHENGKAVFIHLDLVKGIGKDQCGIEFLANIGADGIISTRAPLIKSAKEVGMLAIQRYFAVDSQGLSSIADMISATKPDFIEIMPGVVEKAIRKFASYSIPVIAGGLIETKSEVTSALGCGAVAISTGKRELWYI